MRSIPTIFLFALLGVSSTVNPNLDPNHNPYVTYGSESGGFRLGLYDETPNNNRDRTIVVYLKTTRASATVDNVAFQINVSKNAFQFIDEQGNAVPAHSQLVWGGSLGPGNYLTVTDGHPLLESFLLFPNQTLSPGRYSVRLQLRVPFKDGTSTELAASTPFVYIGGPQPSPSR